MRARYLCPPPPPTHTHPLDYVGAHQSMRGDWKKKVLILHLGDHFQLVVENNYAQLHKKKRCIRAITFKGTTVRNHKMHV